MFVSAAAAVLVIVSVPVDVPVASGLKVTSMVAVCPGFSVAGKELPDSVKPTPVRDAAVTVTALVPAEVSVTVCVADEFTSTFPNAIFVAFTPSRAIAPPSCNVNVLEPPPALAVSVAVCAVLTAFTVAANAAVVDPADTVTEEGTVTAVLSLARLTVKSPVGAAADSVTVHSSEAAPVSAVLAQVSELTGGIAAAPVPLNSTTVEASEDALLVTVSCPVAAPSSAGVNLAEKLYVPPESTVTGRLFPPAIENPLPLIVI